MQWEVIVVVFTLITLAAEAFLTLFPATEIPSDESSSSKRPVQRA